jgi:molybdate transport system substrate-binding protein
MISRGSIKAAVVTLTLALCIGMFGGQTAIAQQPRELLIYCGITMVRPMAEIAKRFEIREKVKVAIAQGGSEDLYQSARKSRVGDLYLPGEPEFRTSHLKEGLLGDYVTLGYNQLALLVRKGNPKKVKNSVKELLRTDLQVIIGNAQSGSIGKATEKALQNAGIYRQVLENALFLAPDSRSLNLAMKQGEADLTLNWRATGFFTDNRIIVDVIDLPATAAKPEPLQLTILTFSREKELARRFMNFAASAEGQAIFRSFGFHDNTFLHRKK